MTASGSSPHLSLDGSGWYTYSPTGSTYYVSSSGSDLNNGLTTGTPKLTIAAGWGLVTSGNGDTLLLNRGDTWTNEVLSGMKTGASATDPIVIGAYGTGARPKIRIDTASFYRIATGSTAQHLVFDGLHIRHYKRDPSDPAYDVSAVAKIAIEINTEIDGVLIQDCKIEWCAAYSILLQRQNSQPSQVAKNVIIHRNIINDQWATNSSGMWTKNVTNLTVTNNVLDNNGFDDALHTVRSIFNHSHYSKECKEITWADNWSSRAASQGFKCSSDLTNGSNNVLIQKNCFWNNGQGHRFDQSSASPQFAHQDQDVFDNLTDSQDGSPNPGLPVFYGFVYQLCQRINILRNLYINKPAAAGTNVIQSGAPGDYDAIVVADNVIFEWPIGAGRPDADIINHNNASTWTNSNDDDSNNLVNLPAGDFFDSTRKLDSYAVTRGFTDMQDMMETGLLVRGIRAWTDPDHNAKIAQEWVAAGFVLGSGALATQINAGSTISGELDIIGGSLETVINSASGITADLLIMGDSLESEIVAISSVFVILGVRRNLETIIASNSSISASLGAQSSMPSEEHTIVLAATA